MNTPSQSSSNGHAGRPSAAAPVSLWKKIFFLFDDVESRFPLFFYLACRFRFRLYTVSDIQHYQERRFRRIAEYAKTYSPYFSQLYEKMDIRTPGTVPTVNKKIMMENLTSYNTLGLTREEILEFCGEVERTRDFSKRYRGLNIGMSSGTSGNKGVELVTPREEAYLKAALFARYPFPEGEKINLAFILRVSAPAFSLNFLGHHLSYVSQLQSIDDIMQQLERIQPNVLSAPPSMLKLIANEVAKGRSTIHPKNIISYAEVLYPDVKAEIEAVFRATVYEIYKCTEGPIAVSCRSGSLHINEDLVLVETLNADGTVTPVGYPCQKMVVTDLHKKSQPIIRYELNDLVTISPESCPCGSRFRVIQSIQGRSDDLFWSKEKNTGTWQFIFPDYISRAIITASDHIEEFQVIQQSPEDVFVRLLLKDGVSEEEFDQAPVRSAIEKVFASYHCPRPRVTIVYEKPEVNPRSLKLIRIHRAFTPEGLL